MTLEGKTALVTGAAGEGMGRSIALTLVCEHSAIIVNYRTNPDRANALVDHIRSQGGTAAAIQADVFTAGGCRSLVQAAQAQFGDIDQCAHGPAWQNRTTTSPQDIVESAAFLCSEAGRFITGCVLPFQFRPD